MAKPVVLAVVALAAFGWTSYAGELMFVGSGSCDGQDTECTDPTDDSEQILWSYVNEASSWKLWTKTNMGGLPAWLVAHQQDHGDKCLFVMLANISKVASYKIKKSGLERVGEVDAHGAAPVHGSISSDGKTLLVANYHGPDDSCVSTGAGAASFSISPECLLTLADWKPHSGSSVIKSRQCGAHVHSFTAGRDNLGFVCDLGMDTIFTYKVGPDSKLTEVSRIATKPGEGPRHSVLHPTKPILYVVTEMGSNLIVYNVADGGALTEMMNITTLPTSELTKGYGSKAAEIVISADGDYVYASNRAFSPGFNSTVAVYKVLDCGGVELVQQVNSPDFPRGMALTLDGKHLVVEGQRHGVVKTFAVGASGLLSEQQAPQFGEVEGPPGCASVVSVPNPMIADLLV